MAGKKRLEELLVRIGSDVKHALRGMDQVDGRLRQLGKRFQASGRQMMKQGRALTVGLTVPLTALAFLATRAADKHEEAMRAIAARTGATGATLDGLEQSFRNVSRRVPQAAGDVAIVLGELNRRLGLTGEQLESTTKRFLDMGRALGVDVAPLAAAAARVFTRFGIEEGKAGDATDFLRATAQEFGIDVRELIGLLDRFGPTLSALGLSFEDQAVLIGRWAKAGVDVPRLLGLIAGKERDLVAFGINSADALEKFLSNLVEGKSIFERSARAQAMLGDGAFDLLKDLERLAGQEEAHADALERVREASANLEPVQDTFKESLKELLNQLQEVLQPVGQDLLRWFKELKPTIEGVVGILSTLTSWWLKIPGPIRQFLVILAGLVAVVGIVILVVGALVAALAALGLGGVAAIVIAAILALIAFFWVLFSNIDEVVAWLGRLWEGFAATLKGVWDWIKSIFQGGVAGVSASLTGLVDWVLRLPGMFFNAGRNMIQGLIDGIHSMIERAKAAIGNVVGAVRKFLPFSPAKEGPLRELPDWRDYLARGLPQAARDLSMQLNHSVAAPSLDTASLVDATGGSGGAVFNDGAIRLEFHGVDPDDFTSREFAREVADDLAKNIRDRGGA